MHAILLQISASSKSISIQGDLTVMSHLFNKHFLLSLVLNKNYSFFKSINHFNIIIIFFLVLLILKNQYTTFKSSVLFGILIHCK